MDLFPQAAVLQEWIAPRIPTDSSSCQKAFCRTGSLQRVVVPARNSGVGSPQTAASEYVYLLQCGSSSCLGGLACFTVVCRGTSPPVSEVFPLLLFHWTVYLCFCRAVYLLCFFCLTYLLCSNLHTSLNMLSQKYHWGCWWAQLWPVVGLFWGQLERAVSNPRPTPGGYTCFTGEFAYVYMWKAWP